MHPLLMPGLLLAAALFQQRKADGSVAPKPPPRTRVHVGPAKIAPPRAMSARAAAPPVRRPTSKPALTVTHAKEHPDVIPAPPEAQAAVDATMSQVVQDIRNQQKSAPPAPPPMPAEPPPPSAQKIAAQKLLSFLIKTGRFGTLAHDPGPKDRPKEIKVAQRELGVAPDGIVGPKTREAAAAVGVALPPRPRK